MPAQHRSDAERDSDRDIAQVSAADEDEGDLAPPLWAGRTASSAAPSPDKAPSHRKKLLGLAGSRDARPPHAEHGGGQGQGARAHARTCEVIELSSGSDAEADTAAAAATAQRDGAHAALTQIRALVPDVDPQFLLRTWVRCGRVPEQCVDALLGENYPLRGGGWKLGRVPREDADGEAESEVEARTQGKKRQAGRGSDGGEEKKAKGKGKGKVRARRPQSDDETDELADDENEVDELASDDDAPGEDDDEVVYTFEEAVDEEDYWLDVEQHAPGGNNYHKAALLQLFRDYDNITEAHIRKLFDHNEMLYVPTWFALHRLKKQGVLVELRGGPRDMEHVRTSDGKIRKRDEGPQSKLLHQEYAWLVAYVEGGGCKRQAARAAPNERQARPPLKKKKEETKEERRARTKTTKVSAAGLGSGARAKKAAPKAAPQKKAEEKQKRKQKARAATPSDDDGASCAEMADGWGADGARFNQPQTQRKGRRSGTAYLGKVDGGPWVKDEDVDAFSGPGFRLGD
ncbi:hypothetical protein JCM3770_001638 [Rhodotorula araucariae]